MGQKKKSFQSKIKSPLRLKAILRDVRKKIVFTNGCFDLIHKGHVTYLERAGKLGDLLVVALNSDASIQRLKGPTRPINSLADRLEVIAALESVSYATWFDDDTPIHLIRLLKPHLLVKGGDWKTDQIVGCHDVLSWGGQVKSLVFVESRSTTQMIAKVKGDLSG